jgi:hypothetical protein
MRFTELTWLAISLASRLGAGDRCRAENFCSINLTLSGIRHAQARATKMECAQEPGPRSPAKGYLCVQLKRSIFPFSRVGRKFAPPRARREKCRTQVGTERTREVAVQNGLRRVNGVFWTQKRNHVAYWVTVFTASPTLKPVPVTGTPTAEISSTSVIRTTPTDEDNRRITWPLAGSLISRVTRSTLS